MHHGTTKSGALNWGENIGAGTKKGIEDPIILQGTYPMHWKQFSNVDGVKSVKMDITEDMIISPVAGVGMVLKKVTIVGNAAAIANSFYLSYQANSIEKQLEYVNKLDEANLRSFQLSHPYSQLLEELYGHTFPKLQYCILHDDRAQ